MKYQIIPKLKMRMRLVTLGTAGIDSENEIKNISAVKPALVLQL